MVKCCAVCKKQFRKEENRSFHKFPKDASVRELWFSILGKKDISITNNSSICSDHFLPSDFIIKPSGIKYLKKESFPSVASTSSTGINLSNEDTNTENMPVSLRVKDFSETDSSTNSEVSVHSLGSASPMNSSSILTASETEYILAESKEGSETGTKRRRESHPRYFGDCHTDDMDSPKKARRNWQIAKNTILSQRKKIRNLQLSKRRLKAQISCFSSLLNYLKQQYSITESAESIIQGSLPETSGEIVKRLLKGPSEQKYTPELRAFVLTLSFYSTKAYNYVRDTFNNTLPHTSTISKWYQSVDGSPGFTKEAIAAVKTKVAEFAKKGQKMLCNIVMDEVAIMQRVEWTGKKFTGYIDIGTDVECDSIPEAKEALVFMLVAINGQWKLPVGYFLIAGLSGNEKANLVNKLLEFINETGVIITSITFDGAPANITMAHILGANFSNHLDLTTFFNNPLTSYKIFIFLDICHMFMLIRNCLASRKTLQDDEGNIISWSYFEKLMELQNKEGLKAGSKISKRYIQWFREKIKVELATQTFSNSVADAFIFLRDDMDLDEFKDVGATVRFTKTMNNLFDIFNCQSRYSKAVYRKAVSTETAKFIFDYLESCKNYISQLTLNGQPILKSKCKTGFLGFLVCIESLKCFYKEYIVETPLLKYILTYKLSQDHLEIFFSIIRSKGGSNNNPTARQLEHIYKRLLIRSEAKGSVRGNVTAIDNTSILHCSSRITKTMSGDDLLESEEYINISKEIDKLHFIHSSAWHLTPYCADVVAYIAGFVVKCLKKCVACVTCLSLLQSEECLSKRQIRKHYGELINASSFVVEICRVGELYLRAFLARRNIFHKKYDNITRLLVQTIRNLPVSIFDHFGDHIFDTDPLQYHPMEIIKLILSKYFSIRIHYETSKLKNLRGNRVR